MDLKGVKLPNGDGFDAHNFYVYSTKYKKRPVVIRALKLEIPVTVETLEGVMTGDIGDYLIEGVAGEFYPCKPDIFKISYEKY